MYDKLRAALEAGRYVPGEHINPNALAREFSTSPTPVLYALYRLVGEGSITEHPREGFHVPFMTEFALRDLYDWMQWLMLLACDIGPAPEKAAPEALNPPTSSTDIVLATRELFEAIALATDHSSLYFAVRQANDRLGPIRRIAQRLLPDTTAELAELMQHWQTRRLDSLKATLIAYYERRQHLVPHIVASLGNTSGSTLR